MLKRLEIQGFKSFAEKTVLEFPDRITAVVGPNGSGKSNVVDAIRWVLGEQSLKNLRSAKSEDVLFAGTPKKPAVSLASVTLHFDNDEKTFPVDYTEVALGRKLYRDGTSEYTLNRSATRLKDIVQLLAAAHMGTRGIAVISQGAGDIFLRSTPDERREMLEEVIGLKEFRIKKEEAERKLEETFVNIGKVSDLLREVEPHLRSLKRQASRWEKRQEKETLLREYEETYFRLKLAALDPIGVDVSSTKSEVEAEIARLAQEIKKLEQEFSQFEDELKKTLSVSREIAVETLQFEEKRAAVLRQIGKLEGRIEAEAELNLNTKGVSREALLEKLASLKSWLKDLLDVSDFMSVRYEIAETLKELDQFLSEPVQTKASNPPAFFAEKDRLERELKELEQRIGEFAQKKEVLGTEDDNVATRTRDLLRGLEAKRALMRQKQEVLQEYRFEEEKRYLHENELRLRMKEAGWGFDEFKKTWDGKEAPTLDGTMDELETKMLRVRRELADIGAIDEEILREFKETEERFEFLTTQKADLEKAHEDLSKLEKELEKKISYDFSRSLKEISAEFQHYFRIIFGGGNAKLTEEKSTSGTAETFEGGEGDSVGVVSKDELVQPAGVEIVVDMPRKKVKGIDMLSGGERALTSIALIFAVVGTSSPPFLVLDEIDAPLDEANSQSFSKLLKELAAKTQFILITHNRATMEAADILYGVTIEDGVSKLFSLRFEEAEKVAAQDVHPTVS